MDDSVALWPAHRLAAAIRERQISSRELLELMLARVERINPLLNAVVTLDAERALHAADRADRATVSPASFLGPLHGLPFTVKDAIEVGGVRSTGGATELADHVPETDAPVVAKLRSAGAIVLGKTNAPTWSADIQTFNAMFGTTNNPWNPSLTSGGSSGGAAAAVATGMTSFEVGTDIGGSIRIPSAFCGVFGHRPSYGLVPQRGYLDRVGGGAIDTDVNVFGPIARSVADLDLLLGVMAGPPPEDAPAWRVSLPGPRGREPSDHRVAVWLDDPACPLDAELLEVARSALVALEGSGARVASSKPPVSLEEAAELHQTLLRGAVSPGLQSDVGDRVGGTHRSWLGATDRRAGMRRRWAGWFEDHDVLICPVMPVPAFEHDHRGGIGERVVSVNGTPTPHPSLLAWNSLACSANLPATAVTVGLTRSGRPVGVQVIGPYLADRTALQVALHLEHATGGFVAPPAAL